MSLKLALTACSVAAAVLSGCSTEPVFERYSLTQDVSAQAFVSGYDLNVSLDSAIDNGGVVVQLDQVTVQPASYHRYSIDLGTQLKALLAQALLDNNVPLDRKVSVYVSKFQGTTSGEAIVEAYFSAVDKSGKVLYQSELRRSSVQSEDGYTALVKGLKFGWMDMCAEVAASLR